MKDEKKAPKLRFKGFTDDWEQCKLGTLFDFKNGLNKGKEFFGSGVPIVNYMDINKNVIINADMVKGRVKLNEDEIERFAVKDNDLFFTRTSETSEEIGFTAAITYAAKNTVFSGFILRARPILKLNSEFYAYYLRTMHKRNDIIRHSSITTRALTSGSLLSTMTVSYPAIGEQNRISYILRKIDSTITLHEKKERQLERLKSALLQKMFADKSGYPAVRFKGFDDIWNQEKLNSLVRLHRGLIYSPNNVQDSGIRVLRSSNILDGKFVMTDDDIFVKSSVVNIPTVKNGDILITAANGSIKLVGKHAIISGISENTAVSGGFMLVGSSRIPNFVNSLFGTSWYQRFIRKYVTGGNGSIGNLKKNDFDKQYVMVPTTSEQERIGEFLKKIDQLIINNQIKHEKLLELKKSLLQNMFI
ncbi:restriction endonuclease subunit S [Lactobacillus delbrueckii]|uniref:restriction endonuclease subunit S n=2 Tax=Lactobacillus delbrueckii TaxID=1584 RepID=UPI0023E45E4C|nr:restriction endonuclease subunit S [Lactobacillus delbrueckii]MDF4030191.1 restriction endonuclease subunit S [Lactobacillus delbrueckii]